LEVKPCLIYGLKCDALYHATKADCNAFPHHLAARWQRAKMVARGETSGPTTSLIGALKVRSEHLCAPPACKCVTQLDPDVSRLATFVSPLPRRL